MQGKSILGLNKADGIFREGTKSGGGDGFRLYGKGKVWKNRRVWDKRGWSPVSSGLVGLAMPCVCMGALA